MTIGTAFSPVPTFGAHRLGHNGPVTEQSADQPTLTSQRLISGRYRLRRVIGRGSMGVVWLAYDEVLHRPVAVKEVQLPDGMPEAEASDVRERTLREARAIAALTHPNVVSVYDVARQGIEPFVVMELLKGRSLAQVINKAGTLNTEQTAVVAEAIAAGLDAAHRRGVIHRDVKPGNVLVGEDGQVKLTDFGISRNVSEVTMTSRGLILGTPAFMAPEVAAGDPVTTASDLWSLGATLFAAVEGRPPYDAGEPLATVNEVVHGEVPRPSEPGPLADVITGLMVKDPDRRMSLMEVRRRIRPLLPEVGTTVFPPDESEADAGPADNKPTTALSGGKPKAPEPSRSQVSDSPRLAADPGPLPFPMPSPPPPTPAQPMPVPVTQGPAPVPFTPQPVRVRRHPAVVAILGIVAVVLFTAAAGGAFAATRTLAGQQILPSRSARPSTPVTQSPAPSATPSLVTVTTLAGSAPGGQFQASVPTGWTKFVEQRKNQGDLPASTIVRWVGPDGSSEMTVERFPGYEPAGDKPASTDPYIAMLRPNTTNRVLQCTPKEPVCKLYLYRNTDTSRSSYFEFVTKPNDPDLWVVTLTVPLVRESGAMLDLFTEITRGFHVLS